MRQNHKTGEKLFVDYCGPVRNIVDASTGECRTAQVFVAVIFLVSAWSAKNNFCFGQVKIDEKSNQITAIPLLLDLLDIKGATITMDAIGC